MIEKWLFEKFELISDAPDAVAKLRELVLQLAVQGKLVPQDDSNESAELLINCAAKQAQKLPIATKYQRLAQDAEEHMAERDLRSLPRGWIWTCSAVIGDTAPRVDMDDDALVAFAPMNLIPTDYRSTFQPEVRPWREIKKGYTHFADGDVAFAKITPCFQNGKGCVFKNLPGGAGSGTTELHVLRPFNGVVLPLYALLFYKSPEFVAGGVASFSGTAGQQRVSNDYFRFAPFPLPPLAEQKRIVAKVDQLMALCDQLEAQQQERETRKSVLVRASLARFADAPTTENLGFLFHKSYDIPPAELRKSILTLAVQGKLVPQDTDDEPADAMLERLVREMSPVQRRRQAAPLPPLSSDSIPYKLPEKWTWSRFRDVAIIASNLVKPAEFLDFTHLAPDNIEKGNGVLLACKTVREDKVISSNHRFYPGQIVYSKIRPNLAKVVVVDFDGLCSADMYPIYALIDAYYLQLYMLSETFLVQAVKNDTRVAMPKINQAELNAIAVPVPPLAEQRRIVAKVSELMALVDELERQQESSRGTACRLLDAIVSEFNNRN